MISKRWMIPAGLAGLVSLGGAAAVVGGNAVTPSKPSATASLPAASPVATTSPADFVGFNDEAGFALSYPGNWERVPAADPQVHLLVAPNDRDSFQLRVVPLNTQIGEGELTAVKTLTDQVVTSGEGVQPVGDARQINMGGLPGWHYLYRFNDRATGEAGIHSHYFLFRGDKMITFVFQALPETSFDALAPVFDKIASTFRLAGG